MAEADDFAEFVRRVRGGDQQAAAELVRLYEPIIRREIRLRLEDHRLRRAFDSMDVCQSVLASFFVRAAVGQFDLNEPQQLVRLLVSIARRKLVSNVRHHQRQRRDLRRVTSADANDVPAAYSVPTPSALVADRELLARFRAGLSEVERRMADLRSDGLEWAEIAQQLGGTAQARRMQLSRACQRVAQQLGIEEPDT